MIQEWSNTNTDLDGLLTGWSETELNPCQVVWEGIICTYNILNKSDNNATEPPTRTVSIELFVVGL